MVKKLRLMSDVANGAQRLPPINRHCYMQVFVSDFVSRIHFVYLNLDRFQQRGEARILNFISFCASIIVAFSRRNNPDVTNYSTGKRDRGKKTFPPLNPGIRTSCDSLAAPVLVKFDVKLPYIHTRITKTSILREAKTPDLACSP